MKIRKINIENYKCFKGKFSLELNDGLNVIVGNNEAGKSTILEALHLVLTGYLNGKYLRNELTQYLFNREIVNEYLQAVNSGASAKLSISTCGIVGRGYGELASFRLQIAALHKLQTPDNPGLSRSPYPAEPGGAQRVFREGGVEEGKGSSMIL